MRRPAARAPSLERSTHTDRSIAGCKEISNFREHDYGGPVFAMVVRRFGRTVEATATYVRDESDWRRLRGRCQVSPGRRISPVRREGSVQRSRVELRRRCLALGADHMWTFTRRGRFESREDALAAFARFERLYGRVLGPYVAVIEPHQVGGFHIHVAVRGFKPVHAVRSCWSRALGGTGLERGADTLGNVDVSDRRGRSVRATASYLAKYLGKCVDVASGRKLFSASKGLTPSSVRRFVVPLTVGAPGQDRARYVLEQLYLRDFESSAVWWCGGIEGFTCWAEDMAPSGSG